MTAATTTTTVTSASPKVTAVITEQYRWQKNSYNRRSNRNRNRTGNNSNTVVVDVVFMHAYVLHTHFELKVISLHPFLLLFARSLSPSPSPSLSVYVSIFHSTIRRVFCYCCRFCFCNFLSPVFASVADGFFPSAIILFIRAHARTHTHTHTASIYTLNFLLIKTSNCEWVSEWEMCADDKFMPSWRGWKGKLML